MKRIANEKMLKESLVYRGDTSKVKRVIEKAYRGEDIVVAFLGGSITQGCNATNHENCYANKTYLWFKNRFPEINVEYINAGIGATGSIIGVHRVEEQVLSKNPDIVFVDFAVNDKDNKYNKIAYDSLIRRILSHNSKPALIEVFMSTDILENVQEQQVEIGKRYDVPMVSFRDAIRNEINDGKLKWREVASDEVHPNDKGHEIISELLINLLESIDKDEDIKEKEDSLFGQPVFGEDYIKGQIMNANDVEVICNSGFIVD
ncbi:SGNH/GDSL hydrolase family protein, partial [Clostridium saudiense]|nr:SGNH/GDSL hydrolase family protein [Clostridium saudiense]